MFLGALMFGYVVGSMASLVGKMGLSASQHRDKMREIAQYMHERKLSQDTQRRMRNYYGHYLARKSAFDEDAILSELSDSLRQEVIMCLNGDVVTKISIFEDQVSMAIREQPTHSVFAGGALIDALLLPFRALVTGYGFHLIRGVPHATRILRPE
jgi:hypothetical protein